ncbi:MAG: Bro-N domain-containing protein [Defluviitaleaceae bacterium]|nr:Bro-N domain-containing protein [Defluviitaleaceae bacterium]
MNNITIFNYKNAEIRAVTISGEPWLVLKDVCEILELTTPARVASRLDNDEVSQTHIIDSLGRKQDTTIINESGLYNLILRSNKRQAKAFRRWVTHEVLPSIRKTGKYEQLQPNITKDPELAEYMYKLLRHSPESEKSVILRKAYEAATGEAYPQFQLSQDKLDAFCQHEHISTFFNETYQIENGASEPAKVLYNNYVDWCRDNEVDPLSNVKFAQYVVNALDVKRIENNLGRFYKNIKKKEVAL